MCQNLPNCTSTQSTPTGCLPNTIGQTPVCSSIPGHINFHPQQVTSEILTYKTLPHNVCPHLQPAFGKARLTTHLLLSAPTHLMPPKTTNCPDSLHSQSPHLLAQHPPKCPAQVLLPCPRPTSKRSMSGTAPDFDCVHGHVVPKAAV